MAKTADIGQANDGLPSYRRLPRVYVCKNHVAHPDLDADFGIHTKEYGNSRVFGSGRNSSTKARIVDKSNIQLE
jgi:hypothetical protein